VRRTLRREVGFGCPVPGCGSPFLTWHHFDPPWKERQHHDPKGMVALCRDHHPEADAGAFGPDQLRAFKSAGRDQNVALSARFNWMRQRLIAVVGGNFFIDCPIAVQIHDIPVVWFGRDEDDNVLVNLQQLTIGTERRLTLLDNFWMAEGDGVQDIECPPSGRLVKARYVNGDEIRVEFQSHSSWDDFGRRFPGTRRPPAPPRTPEWMLEEMSAPDRASAMHNRAGLADDLAMPLTTVSVSMKIAGTDIEFGPGQSSVGGNTVSGNWMRGVGVGIQFGDPSPA
jgi:hypothetical protein